MQEGTEGPGGSVELPGYPGAWRAARRRREISVWVRPTTRISLQLLLAHLWSSKLHCYTALLVKADTKTTESLEHGNKLVRVKDYKLLKYTE